MNGLTPTASLVYDRIEKIAPEYVMRIMTYLSNQLPSEYMSVLASAPDKLFQEIVSVAKVDLQLLPPKPSSPVFSLSATDPRWDSDPLQFCHGNVPSHYQQPCAKQQPEFAVPPGYLELQNQSQNQLLPSGEQVEKVALGEMEFTVDYLYNKELEQHLNGRAINRRHSNISDYPIKICHYFSRGYCKHGNNCRYLHVQASRDEFSPILAPFLNDRAHDHQMFSPGSLEKLELEITEILKSRSGNPLSIATLPTVYYEKYGKVLQAEGYLTESQRQGKAGHSLTRLLSRLGSIRLIDSRPHGQHAVVLAKDAMKYFEGRYEGSPVNSSLRQIYLTFPAESTFSEEDVSKYFSNYGLVEDVRIPSQHNRMFGFVTFVNPETAQMILAKGNPHYVCGARVLVKPYKEKSKLIDRKYQERTECRSQQHMQPYMDADSKLRSVPRGSETSRLLRRQQLMDRHAQAFEFERNRYLAQLQIVREHYQQQQHYLVNSMNALKISEGHSNVLSVNFGYLVDVLNSSSAEDNKVGLKETANPDHESDVLNLQDSTFAASIVNSVIN